MSDLLIREGEVSEALNGLVSGFANDVASIVKNGGTDIYSAVVSSQFDADRLDYMRRDQLMTGTQHGSIDYERSEEHTSELQSLMRISYAVFCLKKQKTTNTHRINLKHT